MKKWQKEKQNLCVRNVDMNLQNGWENVQVVVHGIKWLRKLRRYQQEKVLLHILKQLAVAAKPMRITAVEIANEPRIYTDSKELNRVLGGGIVKGSLS